MAIFFHVNPDGDSIGVGLGLKRGLEALGKEADFVIADPVPEVFEYLPDVEAILHELPQRDYDLMLVADCGDIDRVGRVYVEHRDAFERHRSLTSIITTATPALAPSTSSTYRRHRRASLPSVCWNGLAPPSIRIPPPTS